MSIGLFLAGLVCNVIMGFSLGMLYALHKIRKIQKKTRVAMQELDVLLDEQRAFVKTENADVTSFEKNSDEIRDKLQYISGRLDATGEWFNIKK